MKALSKIAALLLALTFVSCAYLSSCTGEKKEEKSGGEGELRVYCFDAGAADSFVLTTENSTVVIDCGKKGLGKRIVSYLEELGRDSIDRLIITHFDKDHVGGAAKVISSVPVREALQSNFPKDSSEYAAYVSALNEAGVEPKTLREEYVFEHDGVRFTVDAPTEETFAVDPSNNSSLIVTVEYGDCRLLFAGDAENERIADYLSHGSARECAFIKMPHHGRWDRNNRDLIDAVKPRYAVITSSDEEPEDEKTVALLEERGVKIFFTKFAPVEAVCDGKELTVGYVDVSE